MNPTDAIEAAKRGSAATLLDAARSHTAGDVVDFAARTGTSPPSVIVVDSRMTPLEAATLLWENNVIGAPVYDAVAGSYVGMFDARDILSCVTAAHRRFVKMVGHRRHKAGEDTAMPQEADLETKRGLIEKALQDMAIKGRPTDPGAVTVRYLAARNPMETCYTRETPLLDICKAMAGRHRHRVAVIDSSSGSPVCVGIISQSRLVSFLVSKCPPSSMDEKIVGVGLNFRKVVAKINCDETAADAFELLDSHRLSGIAVVDNDGRLVGNTSARDVKLAVMDAGRTGMDMDILSYLARVRQGQVTKKDKHPSCHVHEDATVRHVVNLLARTGFHRVFVVNKGMRPIGVVSFSDIIDFFVEADTRMEI